MIKRNTNNYNSHRLQTYRTLCIFFTSEKTQHLNYQAQQQNTALYFENDMKPRASELST